MNAPAPQRLLTLAAVFALALSIALAMYFSWTKDVWYDEVWSLFVSQHDVPLAQIVQERWLTDIHPPLFYALAWLAKPVTGTSIIAARAINLVGLGASVAAITWIGLRSPLVAAFATTFALAMAGSHHFVFQMIEHRSNFLSLASASVLMSGFYAIFSTQRDYDRRDRRLLAIMTGAALTALNLHYLATVAASIVGGVLIAALWFGAQRRWAVRLAMAYGIAGLTVCIWFLIQKMFVTHVAENFWANTTPLQAALTFYWFLKMMMLANPVMSLLALAGLCGLGALPPQSRRFVLASVIGLAFTAIAFTLINLAMPSLQARYMVYLQAPLLAILAALAAPILVSSRFWVALGFVGSLMGLALTARSPAISPGWTSPARAAADIQHHCKDAAVHFRPYWVMTPEVRMGLALEPDVTRFGMQLVGRQTGLRLEDETSRRISSSCPTLVVAVHVDGAPTPQTVAARAQLLIDRAVFSDSRTRQIGRNFVTVFPAAAQLKEK